MRDQFELGPVPADEPCEQLGPNYDSVTARKECQRYIELLKKKFPNMPEKANFVMTRNEHDFGTYYEVAVRYDDEDEMSASYACLVERNTPLTWDDDSVITL